MRTVYILSWEALLGDKLMVFHTCLMKALESVNSPKLASWKLEDSGRYLGKGPGAIFGAGQDLWRDRAELNKARETLYSYQECLPAAKLLPEAEEMLKVLARRNIKFLLATAEYKHAMFREIANSWAASQALGFYGSVPGKYVDLPYAVAQAKKQASALGEKIFLIASKEEEGLATHLGLSFMEANLENFLELAK